MKLLVFQLWLMIRKWVVLIVLLVNVKHAKTSMNLLVSNQNVIIPSDTLNMLKIFAVHGIMIYFWNKLLVPACGCVQNVIPWQSKKRMQRGRSWKISTKEYRTTYAESMIDFTTKDGVYEDTLTRILCHKFHCKFLGNYIALKNFTDLLQAILAQPCWQIVTILR